VDLPVEQRRSIPLARVLGALQRAGQVGSEPPSAHRDPLDPVAAWRAVLFDRPLVGGGGGPAAVLVALFEEGDQTRVVLTRRSEDLRTHRGQVSFPGGRLDAGESALDAALREAEEEIGLDPGAVEVVGWLHPLFTANAALVLPVVGVLTERPALTPNPAEVARAFDVELAELTGEGVYRRDNWDPYAPWSTEAPQLRELWYFDVDGERVWGATARMLHELALLALGLPPGA
jgi:8-oxo-dGTP pyrophosphatase MutT (NUDIX family)